MLVHVGVEGSATAAEAWERYADLDEWSGWSPQIRRVETAPEQDLPPRKAVAPANPAHVAGPEDLTDPVDLTNPVDRTPRRIRPGLRGVIVGPVGVQVPFEVLAVDEAAMTWTWRVHAALAALTLEHSVSARVGGGCRTDLGITGPAPLVLGYAPLARLALTRLVRS